MTSTKVGEGHLHYGWWDVYQTGVCLHVLSRIIIPPAGGRLIIQEERFILREFM